MVEYEPGDIYIEVYENGTGIKQWMRQENGWHFIDETGKVEFKVLMQDAGVARALNYMNKHYSGLACVMRGEEVLTTDGVQAW